MTFDEGFHVFFLKKNHRTMLYICVYIYILVMVKT